MTIQTRFYALRGGLDLVTPPIETVPGRAIAGINYEPVQRGYQRIDGYERYDGRPRPSEATYWVAEFDQGEQEILAATILLGQNSGATARVVRGSEVTSGSYVAGTAAGTVILTAITGTFEVGENLLFGISRRARLADSPLEGAAGSAEDDRAWTILATEMARTEIQSVPGSGPVRGVVMFEGEALAFRNNNQGTACVMHKATPAGWTPISLGRELPFGLGTAEFKDGETVTGVTSGAIGIIKRVVWESGGWSEGDATGRLVFATVVGAFLGAEVITSVSGSATTGGVDVAITLPPGGRYSFVEHNFFGSAERRALYGVNQVGRGFEWDGEVFVSIRTGMADDRPLWVTVHSNHMFYAYRGGSVQHSSIGNPYQWQVVTGAGEIGLGEEPTALMGDVYGTMFIIGRRKIASLFGTDAQNWQLNVLTSDSGGAPWTVQNLIAPIYLDAMGIRSMETTERFGDFLMGSITQVVEPVFHVKRQAGTEAVASARVRAKDHYRLYWSDGTGLTLYFGRGAVEVMPFFVLHTPTCMSSGKDELERDRLFFGADNGRVYEIDAGTSFDGEPIDAFIRMPFNHVGSPSQRKRWQKIVLELDSAPDTQLGLIPEFGYADADHPPGQEVGFQGSAYSFHPRYQPFAVKGSGGFWEEAFFDQFYWSVPVEGQAESHIDGMGRNMSVVVVSSAAHEQPHTLTGMTLQFTYRGLAR